MQILFVKKSWNKRRLVQNGRNKNKPRYIDLDTHSGINSSTKACELNIEKDVPSLSQEMMWPSALLWFSTWSSISCILHGKGHATPPLHIVKEKQSCAVWALRLKFGTQKGCSKGNTSQLTLRWSVACNFRDFGKGSVIHLFYSLTFEGAAFLSTLFPYMNPQVNTSTTTLLTRVLSWTKTHHGDLVSSFAGMIEPLLYRFTWTVEALRRTHLSNQNLVVNIVPFKFFVEMNSREEQYSWHAVHQNAFGMGHIFDTTRQLLHKR